jgi:hypothetical protein
MRTNQKGTTILCQVCREKFDAIDLLRNAVEYSPTTQTIRSFTPCCHSEETIRIHYKKLERGYIYAAGGPHFSPEEEYAIGDLDYEEADHVLKFAFNNEAKEIKAI